MKKRMQYFQSCNRNVEKFQAQGQNEFHSSMTAIRSSNFRMKNKKVFALFGLIFLLDLGGYQKSCPLPIDCECEYRWHQSAAFRVACFRLAANATHTGLPNRRAGFQISSQGTFYPLASNPSLCKLSPCSITVCTQSIGLRQSWI